MERVVSAVECRTRNQVSPGSNPLSSVSKIGHFSFLHWRPSWLSCINEYLAIDSSGNVSDLVVARNCCMARMLPGEAELVSAWTGLPRRAKSVQPFERSNWRDTALYKNYFYLFVTINTPWADPEPWARGPNWQRKYGCFTGNVCNLNV